MPLRTLTEAGSQNPNSIVYCVLRASVYLQSYAVFVKTDFQVVSIAFIKRRIAAMFAFGILAQTVARVTPTKD